MSAVEDAIAHWSHVVPLLTKPVNEADYDRLTRALDAVLERVGDDEQHPLAVLASRMGEVISAYDEQHRPIPEVTGAEALRYLMGEHGLTQGDLPDVGTQSVVSEILSGRRRLNVRQVAVLANRFGLPASVFIDRDQRMSRVFTGQKPDDPPKTLSRRRSTTSRSSRSGPRKSA